MHTFSKTRAQNVALVGFVPVVDAVVLLVQLGQKHIGIGRGRDQHGSRVDLGEIPGLPVFADDLDGAGDGIRDAFAGRFAPVAALPGVQDHAPGDESVGQHTFGQSRVKELRDGGSEDDQMRIHDLAVVVGLLAFVIAYGEFSHFVYSV